MLSSSKTQRQMHLSLEFENLIHRKDIVLQSYISLSLSFSARKPITYLRHTAIPKQLQHSGSGNLSLTIRGFPFFILLLSHSYSERCQQLDKLNNFFTSLEVYCYTVTYRKWTSWVIITEATTIHF
jgi:hypothetical protein